MNDNTSCTGCIVFLLLICIAVPAAIYKSHEETILKEDIKELKARMMELEDMTDLGSVERKAPEGPNPSTGIRKEANMKKEWKHYESSEGKLVIAYYGLSRPLKESDPFYEGYWISTDLYGSEQFIPKPEFEKNFHEVKKPVAE